MTTFIVSSLQDAVQLLYSSAVFSFTRFPLSAWRERLERSVVRGRLDWMTKTEGPGLGALPQSLASAPLRFVDVRDERRTNLRLVAGMFGVAQAPQNNALSASFGWSVVYDDA